MTDKERAIEIVKHSRQTHVDWKRWIDENPNEAREPKPEIETAGDSEWHGRCISDYDFVLRVLGDM